MGRRKPAKSKGGQSRTTCLPCGKVVRGKRERLRGIVCSHQKVCLECGLKDLSYIWKKDYENPVITDMKSSAMGGMNVEGHNTVNPHTVDKDLPMARRMGNVADTLRDIQKRQAEEGVVAVDDERQVDSVVETLRETYENVEVEKFTQIEDEDFDEFYINSRGIIIRVDDKGNPTHVGRMEDGNIIID